MGLQSHLASVPQVLNTSGRQALGRYDAQDVWASKLGVLITWRHQTRAVF